MEGHARSFPLREDVREDDDALTRMGLASNVEGTDAAEAFVTIEGGSRRKRVSTGLA